VTPAGVVTTLAGLKGTFGAADGSGTEARFTSPFGIAAIPNGDMVVIDITNCALRYVTASGVVSTIAGTKGVTGSTDGAGTVAQFKYPLGVAAFANGDFVVADQGNHAIRYITAGPSCSQSLCNGHGNVSARRSYLGCDCTCDTGYDPSTNCSTALPCPANYCSPFGNATGDLVVGCRCPTPVPLTTSSPVTPAFTSSPVYTFASSLYVEASQCAGAQTCTSPFQLCIQPLFNQSRCSEVGSCIQRRIACLNAAATNSSQCTMALTIRFEMLGLAAGSSTYYPSSTLYLACKVASGVWLNESSLGQCDPQDYLTEACRAPVSTNISISFQGTFSFLSQQESKQRFFAALTTDLTKVFTPAKVSLTRVFVAGRRRQALQTLIAQANLDGVSSLSSAFLQRYSAIALNPQAYFSLVSSAYNQLTGGGLLVVSAMAIDTLDSGTGPLAATFNYTLSPTTTSRPSAASPGSGPTTLAPNATNSSYNSAVSVNPVLSTREIALIAGLSVAGLILSLSTLGYCLLRWSRKQNISVKAESPAAPELMSLQSATKMDDNSDDDNGRDANRDLSAPHAQSRRGRTSVDLDNLDDIDTLQHTM
jgi:hypothetical protein